MTTRREDMRNAIPHLPGTHHRRAISNDLQRILHIEVTPKS
jgi:hypothetical protein